MALYQLFIFIYNDLSLMIKKSITFYEENRFRITKVITCSITTNIFFGYIQL